MWQTPDVGQPDQQIAAAYEAAVVAEPATGAYSNRRRRETRASLHQMFAERKSREGDFTNACTYITESGWAAVGADESQGARFQTAPTGQDVVHKVRGCKPRLLDRVLFTRCAVCNDDSPDRGRGYLRSARL